MLQLLAKEPPQQNPQPRWQAEGPGIEYSNDDGDPGRYEKCIIAL